MNEQKVTEAKKTSNSISIVRTSILRSNEGLKIEMASPIDWSVFANKAKGTFKLGGLECFYPKTGELAESLENAGVKGSFSTEQAFLYNEFPNLSLLLARDIREGVTFNFGLIPIPDSKLEQFTVRFRDQVKTLYLAYLKPIHKSVIINSQTIESDRHD